MSLSSSSWRRPSMRSSCTRRVDLARRAARSSGGSRSNVPVGPGEHAEDALQRRDVVEVVDRRVVDDALAQVDLADVVAPCGRRARRSSSTCRRAGADRAAAPPRSSPSSCAPARCAAGGTFSSAAFGGGAAARRSTTTLRMLVPMRTRSPSFSVARLIFSPLTKVPFVEPRSSIEICVRCTRSARAGARPCPRRGPCRGRSSGRRRSPCRPPSGNSPPWYLPEMKRSASWRGGDTLGSLAFHRSGRAACREASAFARRCEAVSTDASRL